MGFWGLGEVGRVGHIGESGRKPMQKSRLSMHQPRSTAGNGVSMIFFSSVSWDGRPKTQSKGKFPTIRQYVPSPGEHTSTRVKQKKPP